MLITEINCHSVNGGKILIVSPSLKVGGIARVLSELANYFVTKNIYVSFICCLSGPHHYVLDKRVEFIEPIFKREGSFLDKILFYIRLIFFIRGKIKLLKPDSVLSFGDYFNNIVLISSIGLKSKIFISDRTSSNYKFNLVTTTMKKWLYPKATGFIAQSESAERVKKLQFGNKLNTIVINNPLKEVRISIVDKEKIILYVGRLVWEKAPDRLIRAFAEIKFIEGWKLIFVGTGPLLEGMILLANKLGIKDNIVFFGNSEDVDFFYSRASIFVLPSIIEGYPNALCEAMAAGLPVVCFDGFPSHEIISNGIDGIILKDGDLSSLTMELTKLMSDVEYRNMIGGNAKKIQQRLNIDIIGQRYLNYLIR